MSNWIASVVAKMSHWIKCWRISKLLRSLYKGSWSNWFLSTADAEVVIWLCYFLRSPWMHLLPRETTAKQCCSKQRKKAGNDSFVVAIETDTQWLKIPLKSLIYETFWVTLRFPTWHHSFYVEDLLMNECSRGTPLKSCDRKSIGVQKIFQHRKS